MKRFISFFVIALMLCACSSNKSKVSDYLKNTHPEYLIVEDKMMEGTGFMPVNQLQTTCDELANAENQLKNLLPLDKEAAEKMALEYKERFSDVSALLRPQGNNDSKTITVVCVPSDNEDDSTHVVFYLDKEENIDCCSLDFIEYEDEIMNKQRNLMNLVNFVLGDSKTAATSPEEKPESKSEAQPEEENKEEVAQD